jgi:hypothetical protein
MKQLHEDLLKKVYTTLKQDVQNRNLAQNYQRTMDHTEKLDVESHFESLIGRGGMRNVNSMYGDNQA